MKKFCTFTSYFVLLGTIIVILLRGTSMFGWDVLKREVPESVRFCIGDLPMYIFFVPTHHDYQLKTGTYCLSMLPIVVHRLQTEKSCVCSYYFIECRRPMIGNLYSSKWFKNMIRLIIISYRPEFLVSINFGQEYHSLF